MDLRHLTGEQLLIDTKSAAKQEREALTKVLWHLLEVDRRKLFSPKQKSIFQYAIEELDYPEDQAQRRVDAMYLLRRLPEIEPAIASGQLNLTNICKAQTHFRSELSIVGKKVEREEQLQTLREIIGKSTREVARILIAKSSDPEKAALKPETVRPISETMNEMKLNVSDATLEKIARLKGLIAHAKPVISNGDLFDLALDAALELYNPARESKRELKSKAAAGLHSKIEPKTVSEADPETDNAASPAAARIAVPSETEPRKEAPSDVEPPMVVPSNGRRPNAALKKTIWKRANGKCESCGSYRALQEDHRIAFALGGATTAANMRLLCRHCNLKSKVDTFGG